jgi:UDP-N-acetylglucosamine 4,6-dehydratase
MHVINPERWRTLADVARVMAPHLAVHEVGLRPGEKLHEVLCPRDCALETLEFDDHYVLTPSISLQEGISYAENNTGERGRPVDVDFEYSSLHNSHKLSSEELLNILNSSN